MNRSHLFIFHILILHGLCLWSIFHLSWTLWALGLFLGFLLQLFGSNIALHRYSSHHSFQARSSLRIPLIFFANQTCLGSSLSWITTHNHHHQYADTAQDGHSPQHLPLWKILSAQWNVPLQAARYLKQTPQLSWHLFFHRWYYPMHALWILILSLWDLRALMAFYVIPNVITYWLSFSVVIGCHLWGYRNHETKDGSRNNPWIAWMTFGEGWHNNHHFQPQHYSNKELPHETDLTANLIRLLLVQR